MDDSRRIDVRHSLFCLVKAHMYVCSASYRRNALFIKYVKTGNGQKVSRITNVFGIDRQGVIKMYQQPVAID
jgi:hypothetical protein